MYIKTVDMRARLLFGAATLICILAGSFVAASEHIVTVAIHVSSRGLDLNQPADAQTFYRRIEHAAEVVCTHGNRVGLAQVDDYKSCYQKATIYAINVRRGRPVSTTSRAARRSTC
jgi:UrcA family protein